MSANPIRLALVRLLGGQQSHSTPPWQYAAALAVLVLAAIGGYVSWSKYGERVLTQPAFQLSVDTVHLSASPPWLDPARIISDVFRLHESLAQVKLSDPTLTERLHDAFEMHPWIEEVKYVGKSYSQVNVDVEYREPVAVVEFTDRQYGACVLPVDRMGIILPGDGFPKELALYGFIRISLHDPEPYPANTDGHQWGDERVHDCARIANLIKGFREKHGLLSITSHPHDAMPDGRCYVIRASNGATIDWGRAPGEEWRDEPTAQQKLARLTAWLASAGTLEAGANINLRIPAGNTATQQVGTRSGITPISTSHDQ